MRKVIEEFQRGKRAIDGTEVPIMHQLVRESGRDRRTVWHVVEGFCDGESRSSTTHETLRAAREHFDSLPRVGRTKLGRKKRTIRLSDEEYEHVLELVADLRAREA